MPLLFVTLRLALAGLAFLGALTALQKPVTPYKEPQTADLAAAHKVMLGSYDCLLQKYRPLGIIDTNMFFTPENVDMFKPCPAYATMKAC